MTDLQLTFLLAAATGNTLALEQAYRTNTSILTASNPEGRSALHLAALHGHTAVVHQLLSYGTSAFTKDSAGQTPLHLAAQGSAPEIVELLLQNDCGSGCSVRDNTCKTAIFYAYQNPNEEILARFQKYAPSCGSGCALTPSIILGGGGGVGATQSDYFGSVSVSVSASASSCGRGRAPTERTAIRS
ncbi:ankyrin repeat domain-containing protein [Aspergillus mulundensis]|uniref:protein S-acyltransferase n=1 Tax=Aspergillus mulundensis TaxID=1810919 RepID=A0A3D8QZT1_9EURO|nr:Uncharacterized protein DSM5745_09064 [Aspergillus mulundensis]RDW67198.1 Uncharacterized protein DSM5745_09064 [Aspergillus mulundensis]